MIVNDLIELLMGGFENWKKDLINKSNYFAYQMFKNLDKDLFDDNYLEELKKIISQELDNSIHQEHYDDCKKVLIQHYNDHLTNDQIQLLYEFTLQNPWKKEFEKLNPPESEAFNKHIIHIMRNAGVEFANLTE